MSGASDPPGKQEGGGAPAEPTMEDILASIRRILKEDEGLQAGAPPQPPAEDVLILDSSMLVPDPTGAASTEEGRAARPGLAEAGSGEATPGIGEPAPLSRGAANVPPRATEEAASEARLMTPERAAEAAAAVGDLVKRLASERGTLVHHGGPTIEELVREEIRPLLKAWLDANLPALVERLVRAEIERVLGRIAP